MLSGAFCRLPAAPFCRPTGFPDNVRSSNPHPMPFHESPPPSPEPGGRAPPVPAPSEPVTDPTPLPPLRAGCPAGACICHRAALLQDPGADWRVLRLTRAEEQRLVRRLETLRDLADLRHMEQRMEQQLGIRLAIVTSPRGVRTLRGIVIRVQDQPGLCRKTRQAITAAIRRSLAQGPQIAWEIADAGGLFEAS